MTEKRLIIQSRYPTTHVLSHGRASPRCEREDAEHCARAGGGRGRTAPGQPQCQLDSEAPGPGGFERDRRLQARAARLRLQVMPVGSKSTQRALLVSPATASGRIRARNPRWEPGMGMIPDPPQIGARDGGGARDGPPIPGRSGMGMGMDPRSPANRGSGMMGMIPDCRRVPSRALHLFTG